MLYVGQERQEQYDIRLLKGSEKKIPVGETREELVLRLVSEMDEVVLEEEENWSDVGLSAESYMENWRVMLQLMRRSEKEDSRRVMWKGERRGIEERERLMRLLLEGKNDGEIAEENDQSVIEEAESRK